MVALGKSHQDTDPSHPVRLLRPRDKRPCERGTANKSNEFAPASWAAPQANGDTLTYP
jgi:hypothetical protein